MPLDQVIWSGASDGPLHEPRRLVGPLRCRRRADGDQPFVKAASAATLIRLHSYVGAGDKELAQVEEDIRRWSRGSVLIELAPGRKNLLQIRGL